MKSYDELILQLEKYDAKLKGSSIPPHGSNLMHQLNKRESEHLELFNKLCPCYFAIRKIVHGKKTDLNNFIESIVDGTDRYMDLLSDNNPFVHQQDFASSIIPEMFFHIFTRIIQEHHVNLFVQAQDDLPIECIFDLFDEGRIIFKNKRLDLSLCKKTVLSLEGRDYDFIIPVLAMEIKTNLDKNMLAGIENSVESLKKTFPRCLYFVVSELSDFAETKLNYASSDIDEIYILRNQKRKDIRKGVSKNRINKHLVFELARKANETICNLQETLPDLEEKMKAGKLI